MEPPRNPGRFNPWPEHDWGRAGDVLFVANYDGFEPLVGNRADFGVWRPSSAPNVADWYVLRQSGQQLLRDWGQPGDLPIPMNVDADGKDDWVVWRPQFGNWDWAVAFQNGSPDFYKDWGQPNDVPVRADMDGDNRDEYMVWRPSTGSPGWDWYIAWANGATPFNKDWGQPGDVPIPSNFDLDGRDDYVVFRGTNPGGASYDWWIAKPAAVRPCERRSRSAWYHHSGEQTLFRPTQPGCRQSGLTPHPERRPPISA